LGRIRFSEKVVAKVNYYKGTKALDKSKLNLQKSTGKGKPTGQGEGGGEQTNHTKKKGLRDAKKRKVGRWGQEESSKVG